MALVMGQATAPVSGGTPVLVCVLSPGSTGTFMVPSGSAETAYLGTGTASASTLATGNGFPLAIGGPPVEFALPESSTPAYVYAISSNVSTTTIVAYAVVSNT